VDKKEGVIWGDKAAPAGLSVGRNPGFPGHADEVGDRMRTKLFHDPAAMDLYGPFGNVQFRRNLLVEHPGNDIAQYFVFTWGKFLDALLKGFRFITCRPGLPVSGDGRLDGPQELFFLERLGQEVDRPSLHGFHTHGNIAMRGDENNRHGTVNVGKFSLERETGHARHAHIQNNAPHTLESRPREKRFGGGESFKVISCGKQKVRETIPHRGVVINNKDAGILLIHFEAPTIQKRRLLLHPDGSQPICARRVP